MLVPPQVTVYDWLLNTEGTGLLAAKAAGKEIGGFIDSPSGFKVNYEQLKEWSTAMSTELYHSHGLRSGDIAAFMSRNTVWYPVTMFAIMRLGKLSFLLQMSNSRRYHQWELSCLYA
jgi:4-coumarate--CoA ligase